jgi:hypothetical protein
MLSICAGIGRIGLVAEGLVPNGQGFKVRAVFAPIALFWLQPQRQISPIITHFFYTLIHLLA